MTTYSEVYITLAVRVASGRRPRQPKATAVFSGQGGEFAVGHTGQQCRRGWGGAGRGGGPRQDRKAKTCLRPMQVLETLTLYLRSWNPKPSATASHNPFEGIDDGYTMIDRPLSNECSCRCIKNDCKHELVDEKNNHA